jgi:hypothetical protein
MRVGWCGVDLEWISAAENKIQWLALVTTVKDL